MISGDVLKYRKGLCFVILKRYETSLPISSSFPLTELSEAIGTLCSQLMAGGLPAAAALISRGQIITGEILIDLDADALGRATGLKATNLVPELLCVRAPFTSRRRGVELKIIAGTPCPKPDAAMIRGLRRAHLWTTGLKSGVPMRQLAKEAGDGALHRAARATFRAFAKNPDRDSERHPAGRSYSRATGALSPAPGLGRTGTDARKRQIAHSLLFRIKFPDLLQ